MGMLQAGLKPREPRIKVLVPCRLNLDGAWDDACIHNVSSRGLLIASDTVPQRGDYVEIRRGTLVVVGRVAWSKQRFFGIRTQDRVSVDALVNEPRRTTRPPSASQPAERRAQARLASEGRAARRAERSRERSAAMQFGLIAVAGAVAALFVATQVHQLLSRPFAAMRGVFPDDGNAAQAGIVPAE